MQPEPKPISERSRLRRFINRYEVDQAVFFAVISRAWSFLSGPITMLLIASYFTKGLQDYFGIFWWLLGMQTFFELSMDVVIVNVASHEWATLRLAGDGSIDGDETARRRLSSLRQITRRWYRIACIVFLVVIGAVGVWFLGRGELAETEWMAPWCVLVCLAGLQLNLLPAVGLLEGCGQLGFINRVRTAQAVIGSVVMWLCITNGAGLWAIVVIAVVRLLFDSWLVFGRYGGFFGSLNDPADLGQLTWRDEIWPLQWRLGIQSIITYFSLNLFRAVMFEYHPEGVAGAMWMTWTIITTIQRAAFAWVETRRPLFGGLIADENYEQLDKFFFRLTKISVAVLGIGFTAFIAGLLVVNNVDSWLTNRLSERMLGLTPSLILCAAMLIMQVSRCQNIYVRAHKLDPFLVPSLVTNVINVVLIWQLGKHYGPTGAAIAFLITVVCLITPWWHLIWARLRQRDRSEP